MDFTIFELITAFVAIFFGALVQGTIGFGLAIVAAPVVYLVTPELVPGSIILMGMLIGSLTAKRSMHAVELQEIKSALMGRIPGSLLGAVLLTMASQRTMGLFMGGLGTLCGAGKPQPLQGSGEWKNAVFCRTSVRHYGNGFFDRWSSYGTGDAEPEWRAYSGQLVCLLCCQCGRCLSTKLSPHLTQLASVDQCPTCLDSTRLHG